MVSWCKKGACNAQTSPKSELCGLKWANIHNKCVHYSLRLANPSPNPCLMWLHYICTELKLGTISIRSLRLQELGQGHGLDKRGGGGIWGNGTKGEASSWRKGQFTLVGNTLDPHVHCLCSRNEFQLPTPRRKRMVLRSWTPSQPPQTPVQQVWFGGVVWCISTCINVHPPTPLLLVS